MIRFKESFHWMSLLAMCGAFVGQAWGQPTASHQSVNAYITGASFTVTNTFSYNGTLLSLLWRPHLPAGWTLVAGGVSGSGTPELEYGEIVWVGALPASPVQLVYAVQVPAGTSGSQQLRGEVEYQFVGMANPASLYANPDPLVVDAPPSGPTATQQGPAFYMPGSSFTVTNTFSYSGTLLSLLWRPHLPEGWTLVAGGASGSGTPELEYGEIVWVGALPASPVQLVYTVQVPVGTSGSQQFRGEVEYQSSGMANPASLYANPDPLVVYARPSGPTATQQGPASYVPASSFTVTNTFSYDGTLLSLLWRPHLPAGWTVVAGGVSGSGTPELEYGEIVWVGALPSSPVQLLYTVQVPAGISGSQQIRGEVEYQFNGMANPASLYANPDALVVADSIMGELTWQQADGFRFTLFGQPGAVYEVQYSDDLAHWQSLGLVTNQTGTVLVRDAAASGRNQRFYHCIRK
jgi:hypothetical protein